LHKNPIQEVLGLPNKVQYIPDKGGYVPPRDVEPMEEEAEEKRRRSRGRRSWRRQNIPDKFH
jgi:hypothetical protein